MTAALRVLDKCRREWVTIATFVACVALIAIMVAVSVASEREWESYATEHGCSVESTREGYHMMNTHYVPGHSDYVNGRSAYTPGRVVTGSTWVPGETCWRCAPGPRGVLVCR